MPNWTPFGPPTWRPVSSSSMQSILMMTIKKRILYPNKSIAHSFFSSLAHSKSFAVITCAKGMK